MTKDYRITIERVGNGYLVEPARLPGNDDWPKSVDDMLVFRTREELCEFIMQHFTKHETPEQK